jgi:hypothetical protein
MKKLKLSELCEESNLLAIERKLNIDNICNMEETPHAVNLSISGIARLRERNNIGKLVDIVLKNKNSRVAVSKAIPASFRRYEMGEVRNIEYVKYMVSDSFAFPKYSKFVTNVIKTLSTVHDQDSMILRNSSISHNDLKQQVGYLSSFEVMPSSVKAWFYKKIDNAPFFGIDNDSDTIAKHYIPNVIEKLMGWEIETPDFSEIRKFLDWKESTTDAISRKYNIGGGFGMIDSNTFVNTANPLIIRAYNGTNEVVYSGLYGIWKLLKCSVLQQIQENRRRLRSQRNRRNAVFTEYIEASEKKFNKDSVLTTLMSFHPRTWESNNNIPAVPKYYAKSRFPHGSLCAVEIEFVGNEDSPLIAMDWEACGECESCENDASDDCENLRPVSDPQGNRTWEFLKHPMIHWTTDGSVSSTIPKQRILNYQEVRCVQNINDFSTLEKLTKWMNEAKLCVNKTCGLHVHLDTRDISARKYSTIARKAQLATENWLQYCVPFSRFESSYCAVYGRNRWDRYRAVNTTARDKHNTIEFRLGSGSTNFGKISKWIKLCHWIVRGKGNNTTLDGFLKSDANPELKAFVIARICKFFQGHEEARNPTSSNGNPVYRDVNHPASKIPPEIKEVVKTWQSVIVNEMGEFRQ